MEKFNNKKSMVILGILIGLIFIFCIWQFLVPKHNIFIKGPNLNYKRSGHTATLLKDGTVLITGGNGKTAEVYYPDKNKFIEIPPMHYERRGHTATLMGDGRVFLVGGVDRCSSESEIYDPKSKKFSIINLKNIRCGSNSASLLKDGRVLITFRGMCIPDNMLFTGYKKIDLLSADIYSPNNGKITHVRRNYTSFGHKQITLNDGRVLITDGGENNSLKSEIFEPQLNKFILSKPMCFEHFGGTATLLENGNVLFSGGGANYMAFSLKSEIYDDKINSFNATGNLKNRRAGHRATLLKDGRVIVTGGASGKGLYYKILSNAEIYTPAKNSFSLLNNKMKSARASHTSTLLNDERVLIVGGISSNFFLGDEVLFTSEIFKP